MPHLVVPVFDGIGRVIDLQPGKCCCFKKAKRQKKVLYRSAALQHRPAMRTEP